MTHRYVLYFLKVIRACHYSSLYVGCLILESNKITYLLNLSSIYTLSKNLFVKILLHFSDI